MKRSALVVSIFAAVLLASPYALAEEADAGPEQGPSPKKGMKGMFQQPSMIAAADGGVFVLAGPTLTKYDANLEIVKEVELKRPAPKTPPQDPGVMRGSAALQE